MAKSKNQKTDESPAIAENRQARREYEILEQVEVGIVLVGAEVKSIRSGGINLKDSYVRFKQNELFLVGCHIAPYRFARNDELSSTRERKLLLHRREIEKIIEQIKQKGLSVIPLRVYFKNGHCKLQIGVGKGKKLHDRREDVKEREAKRTIQRVMKSQK